MLDAGHHVALHAARQRRPHSAEMSRVLSIGLLSPAPGWVAQKVDADAAEIIAAERAEFPADGVADALLEVRVEGRAARHGNREGGRAVQNDSARPVGEADAGNAEPRNLAGRPDPAAIAVGGGHLGKSAPNRQQAVHEADLLLETEPVAQVPGAPVDLVRRKGFRGLEAREGG